MSDTERLRGKWEKYAPRYDRDIGFFERVQFGGGREWVCAQARGDVLEVAVGTGRNLPFYPEGVRLIGIDFSPAMLEIALARAAELGREVDLREGDAQALPFADASFDTVVATLSLCGIPDERAAIAEMYRVLRPHGTLLLLDHVGSHHKLIHLGQRLLEKLTVRMLGDYQTRRPLPLVEQAGFVIQRQERLKAGTVEPRLREIAHRAAERAPVPVDVVDGQAEALPGDDASVNAVVVTLVLCSVPDQAPALREIHRVLASGGQLRFIEHVRADSPGLARVQRLLDATVWPHLVGELDRFLFPAARTPISFHIRGTPSNSCNAELDSSRLELCRPMSSPRRSSASCGPSGCWSRTRRRAVRRCRWPRRTR